MEGRCLYGRCGEGVGMDQAWDVGRRVIADAIELSYRTEATSGPYECVGCGCPVTAAALTSKHVTPYFRAGRQQPHLPDCQIAGDSVLVGSSGPLGPARTERLGGGVSVPYQLVRAERREQVDPHAPRDPERQSSQSRTSSTTSEGKPGLREAAASTIRPFCRMFIRYPNSRTVLRIDLPGVDAQHYQYAFKRLDLYAITDYPHQRIFYSEVAWRKSARILGRHRGDIAVCRRPRPGQPGANSASVPCGHRLVGMGNDTSCGPASRDHRGQTRSPRVRRVRSPQLALLPRTAGPLRTRPILGGPPRRLRIHCRPPHLPGHEKTHHSPRKAAASLNERCCQRRDPHDRADIAKENGCDRRGHGPDLSCAETQREARSGGSGKADTVRYRGPVPVRIRRADPERSCVAVNLNRTGLSVAISILAEGVE